jgi:dienelactone hydrolase
MLLVLVADAYAQNTELTAPVYAEHDSLLYYVDAEGDRRSVEDPGDWAIRKLHILENMQRVMGRLPGNHPLSFDIDVLGTVEMEGYTRQEITFISEVYKSEPDRVPAYLLIPDDIPEGSTRAAMLALHQTNPHGKGEPAGVAGQGDLHYAAELVERGYVVLVPDYPGGERVFGDYEVDPYALGYLSGTMKGIYNHRRSVDLLQSLDYVDDENIGVIGHSLGGHNSLFVAAFEPDLKAVVTSSGFNTFEKYYGGDLTGWSHGGYMPRIAYVYGTDPRKMPFDFTEVLAALAPRPVFINAPLHDDNFEVSGVRDAVRAARPVYEQIYDAGDHLITRYPDAGHSFPDEVREEAYQFLDQVLR